MREIRALKHVFAGAVIFAFVGIFLGIIGTIERFFLKAWDANESFYKMYAGIGMVITSVFVISSLRFFLDNILVLRRIKRSREKKRLRGQKREEKTLARLAKKNPQQGSA